MTVFRNTADHLPREHAANELRLADHLLTIGGLMPTKRPPRQDGPKETAHELLIRQLLATDERICRNGFWTAIGALAEELDEEIVPDRVQFGFLPDAYRIDRENSEIIIYEVEVRHPLTERKLKALGYFWDWWDGSGEHDWLPRLIVVNRFGHQNELDLPLYAYQLANPVGEADAPNSTLSPSPSH